MPATRKGQKGNREVRDGASHYGRRAPRNRSDSESAEYTPTPSGSGSRSNTQATGDNRTRDNDPLVEAARAALPPGIESGRSLSTLPIAAQRRVLALLPASARSRIPKICCEVPGCRWVADEEQGVEKWLKHRKLIHKSSLRRMKDCPFMNCTNQERSPAHIKGHLGLQALCINCFRAFSRRKDLSRHKEIWCPNAEAITFWDGATQNPHKDILQVSLQVPPPLDTTGDTEEDVPTVDPPTGGILENRQASTSTSLPRTTRAQRSTPEQALVPPVPSDADPGAMTNGYYTLPYFPGYTACDPYGYPLPAMGMPYPLVNSHYVIPHQVDIPQGMPHQLVNPVPDQWVGAPWPAAMYVEPADHQPTGYTIPNPPILNLFADEPQGVADQVAAAQDAVPYQFSDELETVSNEVGEIAQPLPYVFVDELENAPYQAVDALPPTAQDEEPFIVEQRIEESPEPPNIEQEYLWEVPPGEEEYPFIEMTDLAPDAYDPGMELHMMTQRNGEPFDFWGLAADWEKILSQEKLLMDRKFDLWWDECNKRTEVPNPE